MATTILDSPHIMSSQPLKGNRKKKNMNNPKSRVKYAKHLLYPNLSLRAFKMSKMFFATFSRSSQMSMRCSMQEAFWVKSKCGLMMFLYVFCVIAPRCSTSSPTSLLFVVSGAVRLATWKNRTLQWPRNNRKMSRKSTKITSPDSHTITAERQLQLLLRRQVAVVHTDHKILDKPKTDWLDLTVRVYFQQKCVKRSWKWMKLPNLWNSWSSQPQKKNLSSKHCNCSKAQPSWPMLRPDCGALPLSDPPRPYHQVPASDPTPGLAGSQAKVAMSAVSWRKR